MEQAIQKAIEGGYDVKKSLGIPKNVEANYPIEQVGANMWRVCTSDPLFWQALGKAMGWPEVSHFREEIITTFDKEQNKVVSQATSNSYNMSVYHWHRFIDHLAEGRDADSFFANLLKS